MSTLRPLACEGNAQSGWRRTRCSSKRARLESTQVLAHVRKVLLAAAGVDDDVQVVVLDLHGRRCEAAENRRMATCWAAQVRRSRLHAATHLGDNGVVDDAAALVGHDAERASAVSESGDVADDQGLDEGDNVLALHQPRQKRHVRSCRARARAARRRRGAGENTAETRAPQVAPRAPAHPARTRSAAPRRACGVRTRTDMPHMCDTSKSTDSPRHCFVDSMMDALYWMGSSHPANGTILPPCATCRSYSGVRFSGPASAAKARSPSRRGSSVAVRTPPRSRWATDTAARISAQLLGRRGEGVGRARRE